MQTRRFPAAPFGVALVSLLAPFPLAAQPDTVRLTDLVVTATRSEADRRAVAATLTSISGEELRARGFRFVLDWLREVPGVTVVQNGSFGGVTSLFLRGGESDYTKVLIDGVAANQPGGAFNFANLSTDNIERIEILRGPASVLYGSDAVSGVVQIVTRRGGGPTRLDLKARAGTFGTVDLGAEAAGAIGRGEWSAGVSRFGSDGIYPFNNDYRGLAASGRLGLRHDRSDLGLVARLGDHEAHFPTDFAGSLSDSNQFNTENIRSLGLDGGHRVSRVVELRGLATWFDSDVGFDDRSDGPADTAGFGFESTRDGEVRRTLFDLRALVRPSSRLTLTLGAERMDERESLTTFTVSNFGTGAFNDATSFEESRGNIAGYAQALIAAGSQVDVQGGFRFDHNDVFGNFTTGRLGLVYRPGPAVRLFGNGGSAFRQPTFAEQFARTAFEVGNPDLEPERTTSWEAGGEVTISRVTLTATYFAQRFQDLIQYRSAPPGEPTYANVARARADGLETGVRLAIAAGLTANAEYTWLDTEVEDDGGLGTDTYQEGEPLLRRPAHTFGVGLDWRAGHGGWYGARVQHTGSRADVDFRDFPSARIDLTAYTLVDASAEVPLSLVAGASAERFRLAFQGQNLFDVSYESVVGFPGRGRTLLVGLRYTK